MMGRPFSPPKEVGTGTGTGTRTGGGRGDGGRRRFLVWWQLLENRPHDELMGGRAGTWRKAPCPLETRLLIFIALVCFAWMTGLIVVDARSPLWKRLPGARKGSASAVRVLPLLRIVVLVRKRFSQPELFGIIHTSYKRDAMVV